MHAVNNYGSVLQTLATQHIFERLGCEVETLDYIQDMLQMNSVIKILKNGGPGWKIKCKQVILHFMPKSKKTKKTQFDEFRNKYLHISKRRYLSPQELIKDPPLADVYCTGSDQTWNTTLHGVNPAYFLAFVPQGKKRIAFSASFGIQELPQDHIQMAKELLSKYDAISVREESGLKILQQLGIRNAQQVLDPTLVVDNGFWDKLASDRLYKQDYIFVYQLNASSTFSQYVNSFAKKKNMKVLYTRSRKNTELEDAIHIENPSPEDVLSLFKYSSYVITDSFHATVFSLVFHCDFVDIYPPFFSTRIESLLNLTNLSSRHVTDMNNMNYFDTPIDYDKVDEILEKEREKTIQFLKKSIS